MIKPKGTKNSIGFSHIVLYKTNPRNPDAINQIIENAKKYLSNIPGINAFSFAPKFDTGRAVSGYGCDIALNFIFDSKEAMQTYMAHPSHLEFVKFVLNGWMLKGSKKLSVNDRKKEFIDHILNSSIKKDWARDLEVPENLVVWAGEQVYDFGA